MKLYFILFFILSLLRSGDIRIHLVTTNDLHGAIAPQMAHFMNPHYPPALAGWAAYYKYLQDLRDEISNTGEGLLILDGGNFFQGHPVGLADGGKSIIEWMNLLGYQALVPGRYDFILGGGNLLDLAELAEFPFLASNMQCENCMVNIKPFIIIEISGVKIGILGIIPSNLNDNVLDQNLSGFEFTREVESIQKWIPLMKKEGAEVIIILASTGVPWDRDNAYEEFISTIDSFNPNVSSMNSLQLGYFAKGADLIVSGGESKGYKQPWYDPNSHVYVFQNYGNGSEFGHVVIKIDNESHLFKGFETVVAGRTSQTLLMNDFSVDTDAYTLISDLQSRALSRVFNQKLPVPEFDINYRSEINDQFTIPSLDRPDELEVITWNCEFFPKADEKTIQALAEAVHDLNPDIVGFQEIRKRGWFDDLMSYLPEYGFIIAQQSSFMDNAIIYKKDRITLLAMTEPFSEDDFNFAGRPPLQGDFLFSAGNNKFEFSLINIHMKCCDSGLLRRKKASESLHEYSLNLFEDGMENLIILGDWNDDLRDNPGEHCFDPFLSDQRFFFANNPLLNDDNNVSYPKEPYRSFLDHILVTKEFLNPDSDYRIVTLPVETYFGSFEKYEELISDHKPVMVGIPIQ